MSSRDVAHSNIWADLSAQIFEHFPVVYATDMDRCCEVTSMVYTDIVTFPRSTEVIRGQWPLVTSYAIFRVFVPPYLVRWFWIWHPFVIHMCRNRLIGDITYPKMTNFTIFLILTPEIVRRVPKGIALYFQDGKERSGPEIAALACSDTNLSATSHFGHFWVIDLTSEVTGWPRTLNSGVNGFVSWQAARWFLNQMFNSIRSQRWGDSINPLVPWTAKWRNGECRRG